MSNRDNDLEPYVPEWLAEALVPGAWVRFRLGERGGDVCPVCGWLIDDDLEANDSLREFSGGVFRVVDTAYRVDICATCLGARSHIPGRDYTLDARFKAHGRLYSRFCAYAAELTPVEGPDA